MGWKELNNFFDNTKNKNIGTHAFIHLGWIPLTILFTIFSKIFDPSFDGWPTLLLDLITIFYLYWVSSSIAFGLAGLLCIFLGLLTYKDYEVYYSLAGIWFISWVIIDVGYFNVNYNVESWFATFIIILIVSIMNRFNNISNKIDEIHKKLK